MINRGESFEEFFDKQKNLLKLVGYLNSRGWVLDTDLDAHQYVFDSCTQSAFAALCRKHGFEDIQHMPVVARGIAGVDGHIYLFYRTDIFKTNSALEFELQHVGVLPK